MGDSTDQAGVAAAAVGVVGQKNSVEIFINALEKSCRSARIYSYASGKEILESIYENTVQSLQRAFLDQDALDITVKPFEMVFDRKVIYENKDRKTSLSFLLYQDGIRMLHFRKGLSKEELIEIVSTLATDFSKVEMMDQDLYCLFMEKGLPHFDVVGADLLADLQKDHPELKAQLREFVLGLKQKRTDVKPTSPRRMRSDDLKVLEEFKLNPSQFTRTDEEISKVIRSITTAKDQFQQEKDTLERLLFMGFHFLLNDQDPSQLQVGRELVSKISVLALEGSYFPLFESIVSKVQQLQKERYDKTGEYQKILDGIFQPDQFDLFHKLLQNPHQQKAVAKILLSSPPSGVRLIVLLLGAYPWLTKISAEFVLKNISGHMTWLLEEVEKAPERECWEQVVNVLALKPTHHFQKFMESLLTRTGAVRVKALRQLATMGTPEALKFFEKLLQSKEASERIEALEYLALAKNITSAKILRAHTENVVFKDASPEEKEKAYTSILLVAGESSYPWFENLWMQPGSGLFKKKIETERRLLLLKVIMKSKVNFLDRLLEKTPLPTLSEEVQKAAEKIQHLRKAGA